MPLTDEELDRLNMEWEIDAKRPDKVATVRLLRDLIDERKKFVSIRRAFGDYYASEGCNCCSLVDAHERAANELGELLGVDRYKDDSGYDFYAPATEADHGD